MKRLLLGLPVVLLTWWSVVLNTQSAPTVVISANRCTVTLSAIPPDATGGWKAQFLRDAAVSVGTSDSSAPYERTVTNIAAGPHNFYVRWTKNTVTKESPATATVKCELASTPSPPECVVGFPEDPNVGWYLIATDPVCKPTTPPTRTITEERIAIVTPPLCQPQPEVLPKETRQREEPCTILPDPGSGTVVAPSDFTYLGFYRLPSPQMSQAGSLTAKTSGGAVVSLFSMVGELLYEYGIPSVPPSRKYADAPVAPLIRQVGYLYWNNVTGQPCDVTDSAGCWHDAEDSWDYQTGQRRDPKLFNVHSLLWTPDRIWWSMLDFYNSVYGVTDHFLAWTDLTQNEKSGWAKPTYRAANSNVKLLAGSLLLNPDGSLGMVGSFGAISRNTDNSHGPCYSTAAFPTHVGGFNSAPVPVTTTLCYSIGNKAPRAPDYIPDYSNPYNPDQAPSGSTGYWTQVDRMDVAVRIETLSGKRGLVFFGGLGTGQIWYGHYSAGPNGAVDPCSSSTRGENAQGYRPEWRVYDPSTLKSGHNDAVHTFNPQTQFNVPYADWWFPCKNFASGAYWDKPSGRLFVLAASVLHVWTVK